MLMLTLIMVCRLRPPSQHQNTVLYCIILVMMAVLGNDFKPPVINSVV